MSTDRSTDAVPEHVVGGLLQIVAGITDGTLRTGDHSENVAIYSVALADEIGLEEERLVRLRRAAMLHDIGKAVVPEEILAKPGPLTAEERARVERHAAVGADLLEHAGLSHEARFVRAHHERYDGGGYPDGLAGQDIPLEARIIFVADAFETMTSDRPYRRGRAVGDAIVELRRCAGTQFDPHVVEVMAEVLAAARVTVRALRSRV